MASKGNGVDTCKFCGSPDLWGNHFDSQGFGGSGVWDVLCNQCGKFQIRRNKSSRKEA